LASATALHTLDGGLFVETDSREELARAELLRGEWRRWDADARLVLRHTPSGDARLRRQVLDHVRFYASLSARSATSLLSLTSNLTSDDLVSAAEAKRR
jgi:hypothetical protein